jgi:5-methylcytosine-specific restriction enzyme subunit McrC
MAEPKVKNIYYMLSYVFQNLKENGLKNVDSEEFDNIHNLFAKILIHGVGIQIKRGLHRDYIRKEEALAGLRGQINVAATIKQQTLLQGKLVCSYDEFLPDSPHNQVLKSTMLLLLRHGNVKIENKKSLRKLLLYFADVTEVAPAVIRWDSLKYHRNNLSYRTLLGICHFIIKGLLIKPKEGKYKLDTWIQDGEMYSLYEKFVRSYYLQHHSDLQPKSEEIRWDITDGEISTYIPRMKSDITLQSGEKKLIIDTKWYEQAMQYNHDTPKFISAHLYQIYAYVKNSDKNLTGKVAGVLLYAKTDEVITPNEDMVIGGNRISLKTLDLNQDWKVITSQLDDLCNLL